MRRITSEIDKIRRQVLTEVARLAFIVAVNSKKEQSSGKEFASVSVKTP